MLIPLPRQGNPGDGCTRTGERTEMFESLVPPFPEGGISGNFLGMQGPMGGDDTGWIIPAVADTLKDPLSPIQPFIS